jgi:hypothetical protein
LVERCTRSGHQFSPFWGEPIRPIIGFSTFDAVARAEAHPNVGDQELEKCSSNHNAETTAHTLPVPLPGHALPLPPRNFSNLNAEATAQALPVSPPGHALPPPPTKLTKNQKKNLKDRQARNAAREAGGSGPKACSEKYRASAKNNALRSDADLANDLPHSKPAWIGVREMEEDRKVYGLAELLEKFKLRLIEWDGK